MTKICHMTSAHLRYDQRIFEKECVSLSKAGFQVFLVVNDNQPEEEKQGVHICSTGRTFTNRRKRMTAGARAVYEKALALDADIYHFHDPELLPYGLRLQKAGKHVIFDSHENYTQQITEKKYIPHFLRSGVSHAYHRYETNVCRQLSAVIYPAYEQDGSTCFDGRCRRVTIIGNLPILPSQNGGTAVDVERNLSAKIICQPGSLTADRGITDMVRAGYLSGSRVILAGYLSADYQAELFALPESTCIDYRGRVTHDQTEAIIREAGIGISSLRPIGQYATVTNLPTKVMEYALYGLPVICTDCSPGQLRFIEEYHCGLSVPPFAPEDMARAIRHMYEHPAEAAEMGQRGRQAVYAHYDWEQDAGKLIELYRTLA